ncbi:MAG: YhbY family RNA-binding protein [Clostridiales bacterium]|jgi:RNA-binding protein|nr:YhbY family RNA-binding protein [Clostridiales bacterium]
MLTSGQRKILEAKAAQDRTIFQIGKGGLTQNLLTSLKDALKSRELIKINVLNNSESNAKELIGELAKATESEPVAVRGAKIILYKFSDKEGIEHIL